MRPIRRVLAERGTPYGRLIGSGLLGLASAAATIGLLAGSGYVIGRAAFRPGLDALVGMESQFVEGGVSGSPELIAGGEPKLEERRKIVRESFRKRDRGVADKYREQLSAWYGKDGAGKTRYAEAFEICEYGRQPTKDDLRKLFPFFVGK